MPHVQMMPAVDAPFPLSPVLPPPAPRAPITLQSQGPRRARHHCIAMPAFELVVRPVAS
jgi:hypothetical protein